MSHQPRDVRGDVLCVTPNMALDVTYRTATVEPGDTNRVEHLHTHAGGKGVNVARLLKAWGWEPRVLGFVGGHLGDEITGSLLSDAIVHDIVPCQGDSRRTVTVISTAHGTATGFYESGPTISAAEWEAFRTTYETMLPGARLVVLAGSLPPGVPDDAYRQLTSAARGHGLTVIIDASGKPMLHALDAEPSTVTPNETELAEAVGLTRPISLEDAAQAARRLTSGGAQRAVVTLGARGLIAADGGRAWRAWTPPVHGNPVGAGDAVVAVIAHGALTRQAWPETLRHAAATAAAAVRSPIAGAVDPRHVADMLEQAEVDEL